METKSWSPQVLCQGSQASAWMAKFWEVAVSRMTLLSEPSQGLGNKKLV